MGCIVLYMLNFNGMKHVANYNLFYLRARVIEEPMFQRISNLKKTNSIILSAPYNDGKYKIHNYPLKEIQILNSKISPKSNPI